MNFLKIRKEGHLCWVTMNRPQSINALNTELLTELTEFNNALRNDLNTRVVIFRGQGGNFSSGKRRAET